MNKILAAREKIYDHIEDFSKCGWHATCSHTDFERYCIAKDTIQDTAEALLVHREQDFVDDVYRRYVEYYGVLQAVYMQQDAIEALFNLFMTPGTIEFAALPNWQKLRDLRNDTAGHPVGRLKRLNRGVIAYDCVNYQWCPDQKVSSWKSKDVNLAALLDAYDPEAAGVLDSVFRRLEAECAAKHTQQDKSSVRAEARR
jgi:hypothetical protein